MQHINDDIDDLFRNAADNYPLKVKGADWESVAGRLKDGDDKEFYPLIVMPSSKTGNKGYRYLLLLLLLPIGFFAARYAGWMGGGGSNATNDKGQQVSNVKPAPADDKTQKAAANTNASDEKSNNGTAANNVAAPTENPATGTVAKQTPATGSKAAVKNIVINKAGVGKKADDNANTAKTNNFPLSGLRQAEQQKQLELVPMAQQRQVAPPVTQPGVVNSGTAAPLTIVKDDNNSSADGVNRGKANTVTDANPQQAVVPGAGDKKDEIEKPVAITKQKRFYIGAFVAPEYTTIKYQPGNKVGFNFGGLIGYSFTKNLALEVGISTDKKYYTTDGKYYNSTQKWIANSGKLLTLSGYSSLTEFPVNIKYSFKPGRDGNFFASGGLVSYIVHEENYDYEFDKSGFIYHKDKSSRISTHNAFANINISAGYESSLGNFCSFRIEPYYRIPVKGIGLGSLPITNIGLNIGITKKIK